MPTLSIVVPTYNEGGNVAELLHRLDAAVDNRVADVLFVDDSTDDTPHLIRMAAQDSLLPVRLLHRDEPVGGLAGAVAAGIRASDGEYVLVMDGDLQHPPELVGGMVETATRESADLVVASRYCGTSSDAGGLSSGLRRAVSSGSTLLARSAFPRRVGRVCSDPMTGFFCFRREAVDLGRLRPRGFKILLEIMASHDLRVAEVPFTFGERHSGESKASWRNGMAFMVQLVVLRLGRGLPFALVGAAGFLLNLLLMAVMLRAGVHYLPAALVATEATIVTNFLMQERYVFHDLRSGHHAVRTRALQSVLYNNADAAVRLPFLVLLVEQARVGSLLAQGLTLVASFAARFAFAQRVMYRPVGRSEPASYVIRDGQTLALPPTDTEKLNYLKGPQHRWFFWAHLVSFIGIAFSLYGFARMRYSTLIFLVPLVIYAAETLLGLWTSTFRRNISLLDHEFTVQTYRPQTYPSVDVFLPTAGEPAGLLANTYEHVALLSWPGRVQVHVLDDMARPEIELLASKYGFNYLARPGSEFKKAGNLRYAFDRTDGEHILILDADFVPRPDTLFELVPYMQDPAIAHSEDVFTGFEMDKAGYRLQYVPVNVTQGVCPDEINGFITQQYRWCEGSMEMLSGIPDFHTTEKMNLRQRAAFWSGFTYYITTALNAFFAPIPALIMIWAFPGFLRAAHFLPLTGLLVLWLGVYPVILKGRWRLETLRVQTIYSFTHAVAIYDVFFGRTSEWSPTGVGTATPLAVKVKRIMVGYLGTTMTAVVVGLGYRLWEPQYTLVNYWAAAVFIAVNLYIFVPVIWTCLRSMRPRPVPAVIDLGDRAVENPAKAA